MTFNQQEAAELEIAIQKMVDQAAKQAFAEGQKAQRAACRSLI